MRAVTRSSASRSGRLAWRGCPAIDTWHARRGGTGYLQTRGFVLEGRELRADADVRGYLRVGATEGRGELLPGLG